MTFSLCLDEVVIWCEIISRKSGGMAGDYVNYKVKLVSWKGMTKVSMFIDISN